jgi:hypothetical protein
VALTTRAAGSGNGGRPSMGVDGCLGEESRGGGRGASKCAPSMVGQLYTPGNEGAGPPAGASVRVLALRAVSGLSIKNDEASWGRGMRVERARRTANKSIASCACASAEAARCSAAAALSRAAATASSAACVRS